MHVALTPQVGWEEADYICCDPQLDGIKHSLMFTTVNILSPCASTHLILSCVIINLFVFTYIKTFVNKLVYGMRVHQNTWGRVSQAQKQVQK